MILTLALVFVLGLTVLTGCGDDKHEFSDAWETDGTYHWHRCTTIHASFNKLFERIE